MTRKTFLKRLSALPMVAAVWRFLPDSIKAASPNRLARRVRPLDSGWPDAVSWEKLNQSVGGRLVRVKQPWAGCAEAADSAACQKIIKDLQNPFYIGDQPGGTQSIGWVDAWMAAPSVYAVAAENPDDVVAGVNFARTHNLRLVVKGGGHSYHGTSNASDSLLIWTRAMNKIVLHDAFVAKGCSARRSPQPAVTIEAGALWIDAYQAVTTQAGRYVQGGGCSTVGVAGLIQSGGFGSFSKRFGTAAAGLLEAEIVTADGSVLIANACTNPDLFWALKGGGGGSFGVVTKVTLRTRELPEWFGVAFMTIKAASDSAYRELIGRFMGFYHDHLFNPHWGETVVFGPNNVLAISMISQGLTTEQAEAVWQPFLDGIKNSVQSYTLQTGPFIRGFSAQHHWDPDFYRKNAPEVVSFDPRTDENRFWWSSNQEEVGVFWHGYESAWLAEELLAKDQPAHLADALYAASRHWPVGLHFNKGLAGAPQEEIAAAQDTATNPAVLSSFALAIIAGGSRLVYPGIPGYEPDLAVARQNATKISEAMNELRKVIPEAGSYVSESNYFNEAWQQSYWAQNYSRLRAIKDKYDPTGLFFVHHGAGSEDWSADGFERS